MDRNKVIELAFRKACKFMRDHPAYDTCEHIELVQLVYDGKSDPEGRRYAGYFLQQAVDELKERENEVRDSDVTRYWRIKVYTPFCGEEKYVYYSGTSEDKMHKFAQEATEDNASEWWADNCGMDEEEYLEECGYGFEEISYETFREERGY